jgi:acetolactate synthase-1/2/3 large subunit
MILVGGGARDAAFEVQELAELLEAPVVSFRSGRGIVSDRHPLRLTHASGYPVWHSTDAVVAIGTRMEMIHWRWPYVPNGMQYIRVDIDPAEMRRFESDAEILADARTGTRALIEAARKANVAPSGRRELIAATKTVVDREVREALPQAACLDVLREVLPDDGIVTDEVCQAGFASWFAYPVYNPRTLLTSGYAGTLGAGFPMALGAKVARPDTPVVSITGDGGFLFAASELATAVQYKIAVVTLVFNNNAYGNVLRDQRNLFEGRTLGSELVNPDFVKLAESYGAGAARIRSAAELRPLLERALASGLPWVIEVEVSPEAEGDPWPFIHPPKPSSQAR